jgi:DNA gyrase/topoisomerase IV subunit A
MVELIAEIDGVPLSRYGCDGLVVATPTGSTAYAFSAGGPIVSPDVDALVLVPISAHALFARPIVLGPDAVVAMEVLTPGGTILSVTEQGYGKRTGLEEYRIQSRGGIGIINIQTSERNGKVIGIAQVSDDAELMLITQQGKILRMAAKDIRTIGRATQGVKLIDIEGDDRAVSIARLAEKDEEE